MPAIQIDDRGTQFYYYDSGVPALRDIPYTTLVLCHGYAFNTYTFRPLLPLAAASHIRLVLVNRRGYHGSTPLDASETTPEDVNASPKLYKTFLQNRAKDLAAFLVKFIELEEIPPKIESPGRASGGISLVGWSLGNIPVMSLLGFADTLDSALIHKLETHLRKVIQYDPPYWVYGWPDPPGSYFPLLDPTIPIAERTSQFAEWVSSYWTHSPEFMDAPISDLLNGLLEQQNHNPTKAATVTRFTAEELSKGLQQITYEQGDNFIFLPENRHVTFEMLHKVLFTKSSEPKIALANIEISCIFCKETCWAVSYSAPLLKAEMNSAPPGHHLYRPVKFSWLEGCNHFAHYDDPVKMFAALAQTIEY